MLRRHIGDGDAVAAARDVEVGDQDQELVPALAGDDVAARATAPTSRCATSIRSSSPAPWPKLSLTSLKSSRSTYSTATP